MADEIEATGSLLTDGTVRARLELGGASLSLEMPIGDPQAAASMVTLVERSEGAFADVLEALINKAEADGVLEA